MDSGNARAIGRRRDRGNGSNSPVEAQKAAVSSRTHTATVMAAPPCPSALGPALGDPEPPSKSHGLPAEFAGAWPACLLAVPPRPKHPLQDRSAKRSDPRLRETWG